MSTKELYIAKSLAELEEIYKIELSDYAGLQLNTILIAAQSNYDKGRLACNEGDEEKSYMFFKEVRLLIGIISEHPQFSFMTRSSTEDLVKFWEFSTEQIKTLLISLTARYALKYPKQTQLKPLAESTTNMAASTMKLTDVKMKDILEAKVAISKENEQLKAKITENSKKLKDLDSQFDGITKENKQKTLQKQRIGTRNVRLPAERSPGSSYERICENETDEILAKLDELLGRFK